MAKPNWKKIAAEYVNTEISTTALAKKYGVSYNTLKKKAASEMWVAQREKRKTDIGKNAVQKYQNKYREKTEKEVTDAELLLEGASLAIQWIVNRLESGEVSDYREVESLIRAMNGSKAITKIKMALDEQEQRARIASLEKDTEVKSREPIRVEFSSTSEGAAQ